MEILSNQGKHPTPKRKIIAEDSGVSFAPGIVQQALVREYP